MMDKKIIFLAELDDDLQELAVLGKRALAKRIFAYFLLADEIIIHPAYIWQSRISKDLIFGELSDIFDPEVVRIALGDSVSTPDYINDRISRLKESGLATSELERYASQAEEISRDAEKLDKRFPRPQQVEPRGGRDERFRRLLKREVGDSADPESLRHIIESTIRKQNLGIEIQDVREKLATQLDECKLISVDTLNAFFSTCGLRSMIESIGYRKRILTIYYHANASTSISVPGASAINQYTLTDPFDADTFWLVFATWLGQGLADRIIGCPTAATVRALRQIRDQEYWNVYREAYFNVLSLTEVVAREELKEIVSRIAEQLGRQEHYVLRMIWRRHRRDIISAGFSAVGAPGPVSSLITSGLSILVGLSRLPGEIKRFAKERRFHDLTHLEYGIRQAIHKHLHR